MDNWPSSYFVDIFHRSAFNLFFLKIRFVVYSRYMNVSVLNTFIVPQAHIPFMNPVSDRHHWHFHTGYYANFLLVTLPKQSKDPNLRKEFPTTGVGVLPLLLLLP